MSNPPPAPPEPAAPSVIERFVLFITALCKAVVEPARGGLMAGPLTIVVWNKLQRFSRDWAEFAAQVRAGTLPERPARNDGTRGNGGDGWGDGSRWGGLGGWAAALVSGRG